MDLKKNIVLVVCVLFCVALIAGCSCSRAQTSNTSSSQLSTAVSDKPSAAQQTQTAADPTVIGVGSASVSVKNDTGLDFTTVSVKATADSSYADDHTFDNVNFANGDTKTLKFNPIGAAAATANGTTTQHYDVRLTTADDSIAVITDIDLPNLKDIVFKYENGIGYITYTDASTGQSTNNQSTAIEQAQTDAQTALPPDAASQSDIAAIEQRKKANAASNG